MALINCPECNNQVSNKADTCPHCGVRICDYVALKTEQEKVETTTDKIIFSTKKDKRNPMFWVGFMFFTIVLVFAYFFLINWIFGYLFGIFFGYFFGVVSSIAVFILCLFLENNILQQDRSYVDVYENHIEGVTFKSKECEGGVNFSVLYSEILKVDTTQGFIIIHTRYNQYKVQALKKEAECKNIICKKLLK